MAMKAFATPAISFTGVSLSGWKIAEPNVISVIGPQTNTPKQTTAIPTHDTRRRERWPFDGREVLLSLI